MLDILLYAIMFGFAFIAGYIYREIKFIMDVRLIGDLMRDAEKITPDGDDIQVKNINQLRHEIVDGVNYFYTDVGGGFAGQGSSLEDAAVHFTHLHGKDILGWFQHVERGTKYCFINGQCLEYKNE